MPVVDRFWLKISGDCNPDGCWNFTGCKIKGYGQFPVIINGQKEKRAHRIAWILSNKMLVPNGQQVLHHCDNPSCCNPMHLYLGTPSDNNLDMRSKGRGRYVNGERHGRCTKLNESKVGEMRRLKSQGVSNTEIAETFGVSLTHVGRIVDGKNWK